MLVLGVIKRECAPFRGLPLDGFICTSATAHWQEAPLKHPVKSTSNGEMAFCIERRYSLFYKRIWLIILKEYIIVNTPPEIPLEKLNFPHTSTYLIRNQIHVAPINTHLFIYIFSHRQHITHGQFWREVQLVWIQFSFILTNYLNKAKYLSLTCYLDPEDNISIHAFPWYICTAS